jgi:hypothetical protein
MTTATEAQGPTRDKDLYSFATMKMETRARNQITNAVDTDGLARWFSDQLSEAYGAGLRDGYVQGRHDRHKDGEAT